MKRNSFVTVGVGGLLLDHIFSSPLSDPIYLGTAGGGSTWNCLANLAFMGHHAYAVGRTGDDIAGELATDSLRRCGVDVTGVLSKRQIRTQIIFEQLDLDLNTGGHKFVDRCLVCDTRTTVGTRAERLELAKSEWPAGSTFICMDRISVAAQELAIRARNSGVRPVLDLGHLSPLRYIPVAAILSALRRFDVVLMPARVAASIQKRAGFLNLADLVTRVGISVFCVSEGEKGAWLFSCERNDVAATFVPPVATKPLDTSGAGDAFLALLLDTLSCSKRIDMAFEEFSKRAPRELAPVLGSIGARGHIPSSAVTNNVLEAYLNKRISVIRNMVQNQQVCPFCETHFEASEKQRSVGVRSTKSARRNVSVLLTRALFAAEKADAVTACRSLLDTRGTAYVVGTGGSYPSAVFTADALNSQDGLFAQAIKPLDYLKRSKRTDLLVVVSYSGRTSDCAVAIRHAQAMGVERIALVTAAQEPDIGELLRKRDLVICYGRSDPRERGFVSITGTVAPCALWAAAVCGTDAVAYLDRPLVSPWSDPGNFGALTRAITSKQSIDAFGSGFAAAALLDFESKLTEGNLGRVILHESKDFSHGRFSFVFGEGSPRTFLVLRTQSPSRYEESLIRTLGTFGTVVDFRSTQTGLLGGLELLVGIQFLAVALGTAPGKDISCPGHISEKGLRLYRWRSLP